MQLLWLSLLLRLLPLPLPWYATREDTLRRGWALRWLLWKPAPCRAHEPFKVATHVPPARPIAP